MEPHHSPSFTGHGAINGGLFLPHPPFQLQHQFLFLPWHTGAPGTAGRRQWRGNPPAAGRSTMWISVSSPGRSTGSSSRQGTRLTGAWGAACRPPAPCAASAMGSVPVLRWRAPHCPWCCWSRGATARRSRRPSFPTWSSRSAAVWRMAWHWCEVWGQLGCYPGPDSSQPFPKTPQAAAMQW